MPSIQPISGMSIEFLEKEIVQQIRKFQLEPTLCNRESGNSPELKCKAVLATFAENLTRALLSLEGRQVCNTFALVFSIPFLTKYIRKIAWSTRADQNQQYFTVKPFQFEHQKGQNQVSTFQRCPYYRSRCFGITRNSCVI